MRLSLANRFSSPHPEQCRTRKMLESEKPVCLIEMVCATKAWPWQLPFEINVLHGIVAAMAAAAGFKDGKIQIRFVNDTEMANINGACLGCSGPTNVITFPGEAEERGIAVSLDCLHREALLYGQNPSEHLVRLLAHGFGHLGDYDHGEQLDAIQKACEGAAMRMQEIGSGINPSERALKESAHVLSRETDI